jgi:hypothetical protein
MTRADESLIRDIDLRERLEEARGKFAFDIVAHSLVSQQQKRDEAVAGNAQRNAELAAMPRDTRRRATIREIIETKPPAIGDMRHIHSVLAVCGLPYNRQPLDVRRFERSQGQMSLVANAGELQSPNGTWEPQPLPFGPKARLLMMHLCSEAIRQKSAVVEIADSLTAFVRDMGFNDSGGTRGALTAFKLQINALAACTLRIGAWDGTNARTRIIVPFESIDVWLPSNPNQRMLWPSTVTFSDVMYKNLERHALPVNAKAVRAFAGSARKLDLYFWLGYRLYNIQTPLRISWEALASQFGQGFTRPRAFRAQLAEEIRHIREVFPKLPLRLDEVGLHLEPADPTNVLALPALRAGKGR